MGARAALYNHIRFSHKLVRDLDALHGSGIEVDAQPFVRHDVDRGAGDIKLAI